MAVAAGAGGVGAGVAVVGAGRAAVGGGGRVEGVKSTVAVVGCGGHNARRVVSVKEGKPPAAGPL